MFSTNAFAASYEAVNKPKEISSNNDEVLIIWESLKECGDLKVDANGLLIVNDANDYVATSGYSDFLDIIDLCNESIIEGILVADAESAEIASVIVPEKENIPFGLTCGSINRKLPVSPRNAAHGCSVQALNLITMCENNYKTLSNYYNDMLRLSIINPNLSPWGATVGFWIGKVAEGGDWDYKVQPGFSPWYTTFCSYFNGSYQHITSEYIGNFNYGYTGSFLFSLDILHFGSSAVAGFDPADEEDWPAIDAGFNAKTK